MNSTVQNTASTALGLSGGTLAVYWLLACVKAGSMQMPDEATITAIVACLAPITHAVCNLIVAWFNNRLAKLVVVAEPVPPVTTKTSTVIIPPGVST